MSRSLEGRLAKIEAASTGPSSHFVVLPHDAAEHGEEHFVRMKADALRDYRSRTGRRASFAIITGVPRCDEAMPLETRGR
jgi:hypothetical protein